MYAASAIAANTVARSAAGAAAPLFTNYMFEALGIGGGGSLIGGIAVLLAPTPFLFYKYGRPIRERSKFAPTPPPQKPGDEEHRKDETRGMERTTSGSNSSEEAEKELDDQAGVPYKEIEKAEQSPTRSVSEGRPDDRFLDASGLEKAEK